MEQNKEELLKHLAASLQDAKDQGGAILLVGAGISVSAGVPPAQKLMQIAIENFPNYFTKEEQKLAQENLSLLQYNDIMTKLSNVKRKELFKWFIEGNKEKGIKKAKLNFAHIAIAELLKQGYFSRILTVNFDPLLIHACYMVGMYPFPAIYDLGAMGKVNAELLHDPSIVYLNGQHVGFVQRNTTDQLEAHKETLTQIVRSTGCSKTWVVAGYSGENDPLMDAIHELRPYNNWLYWLEYNDQVLQRESHYFLEKDEECKVIYRSDADETFMEIADFLNCQLDFIEKPENELRTYLNEINFESESPKIKSYKEKILRYISLFKQHRKEIQRINEFHIIFNTGLNLISQDKELRTQKTDNDRLPTLYEAKLIFEKAIELDDKNFASLFFLSFIYLSIFTIKKSRNILEIKDNELIDLASNVLERIKVTNEFKDNKFNEKALTYFNQSCLNALKSNVNDSLLMLEKALKINQISSSNVITYEQVFQEEDFIDLKENPDFLRIINSYLPMVEES